MAVREDSKGDTESAFFYRAQASYLALKEALLTLPWVGSA